MSQFARFFGIRLLLVFVVFGYVSNIAIMNRSATSAFGLAFISAARRLAVTPLPGESLRHELARMQKQTGLSLVWVAEGAVQIVVFSHRSRAKARRLPNGAGFGGISPDGNEVAFDVRPGPSGPRHLGISRTDGSDFREYANIAYSTWLPSRVWDDICWSYNKSMLATTLGKMEDVQGRNPSPQIVNVSSGETQEIENQV
jgi:hypothetical protein